MGRFLGIGIDYELIVSEKEAKRVFSSLEEVTQKILDEYNVADVYNIEKIETDKDTLNVFTLKSEIIETELYPFTKDFFSWRFPHGWDGLIADALSSIKPIKTLDELLEYAKHSDRDDYLFQNDEFGDNKTVLLNENNGKRFYFRRNSFLLSADGKIFMECYNEIFYRIAELLKEKYRNYKISKAIDVYITG
jgi:hypothetical protein